MTCKDCLCSDVCIETRDQIQMVAYQSRNDVEKVCHNFKDKTRFVELPCKVGDTLYCDGIHFATHCAGEIHEFKVDNIITKVESYFRGETDYSFDFEDFGKTVFLTREEAEKALKRSKE